MVKPKEAAQLQEGDKPLFSICVFRNELLNDNFFETYLTRRKF